MDIVKLRNRMERNLRVEQSRVAPRISILNRARHLKEGLRLFLFFLTGRLPVHHLRVSMYRNIFGMQIGIGSIVHWRLVSFAPERVRVGEHSILGNDGFLDGRSGITIGDNVNIAAHVHIYTLEHDPQSPDFATKGGPVDVGDRVFIGSRATILPNIKLGTGAVVAAGAVVTHDVDKFTIVAGVPAKKVGERTEDLAYMLSYHLPFQ